MKTRYRLPIPHLVLVGLAAGIAMLAWLLYRSQQELCRTKAEYSLTAIANLKVSELSRWRQERLADAELFYGNNAFATLLRRCVDQPQDVRPQEELRTWLGHFQAKNSYELVVLFDANGKKWMMFPDKGEPPSSIAYQQTQEALRLGHPTFVDFYRASPTQPLRLRLFIPIVDGQTGGRPLGVLMLRIDPSVYLYPSIESWPMPGLRGRILLIRREGDDAVILNELADQRNAPPLTHHVSMVNTERLAVKAALGQEGIVEGIDGRGAPVLGAVRAVPDSPWSLVAQMDVADVYSPIRQWVSLTVLFVCALVLGTAVTVVVVHAGLVVIAARLLEAE
jgi:hypothetical protein